MKINHIKLKNLLKYNFSNAEFEAGTDEAGRGCLAGPVFAAAVITPIINSEGAVAENPNLTLFYSLINDSKKLSEKTRNKLRLIIEDVALAFTVTAIYPDVIDEINILNASILAMQESVLKLNPLPTQVIVDGNAPFISKKGFYKDFTKREKNILQKIKSESIIKGDAIYISIAAASILAKTYRDQYMLLIHEEYPMYNWKKNKGYPTKEHREAIAEYGLTKYHRLSFKVRS